MRRKRNRTRRTPAGRDPVQVVIGLDGQPFHGDDGCPLCAAAAAAGRPLLTPGEGGELIEVVPRLPPMIEVVVQGTASTWPYLEGEPAVVPVPEGCLVGDLLDSLPALDRDFLVAFPPGTLWATIGGAPCEPDRALAPGDHLIVHGRRDPAASRRFAELLAAPGPSRR